jgi:hypothetical protein
MCNLRIDPSGFAINSKTADLFFDGGKLSFSFLFVKEHGHARPRFGGVFHCQLGGNNDRI